MMSWEAFRLKWVGLLMGCILTLGLSGCDKEFRLIVQDSEDNPVPGAIVYVESYNHMGVVDFTFVVAGDDITVPAEGDSPISLSIPNDAKVAIAVFAKGKKTFVMNDPSGQFRPELWEYMLEDELPGYETWNPKLGKLGFPFVHHFTLADRLKLEKNKPLREAFRKAYQPLEARVASNQAMRYEIEKFEFLKNKIFLENQTESLPEK